MVALLLFPWRMEKGREAKAWLLHTDKKILMDRGPVRLLLQSVTCLNSSSCPHSLNSGNNSMTLSCTNLLVSTICSTKWSQAVPLQPCCYKQYHLQLPELSWWPEPQKTCFCKFNVYKSHPNILSNMFKKTCTWHYLN